MESFDLDRFKKQTIMSELIAARKSRDWKDYVNTGKGLGGNKEDKSKRVRRYLLVAKALDALEDVPV